tara:strand:- start:36 stop:833 length:798 start_codon:yes stop_codon:yes gene_type:complete
MAELTTQELQEHLTDQLQFIESSITSFDNGFEGEIKRLAVSVRVLVHDTGKSTSLLTLLRQKNVDFIDTSIPFDENNKMTHSGLVQMSLGNRASKALPLLDDGPFSRMASFELWWNGIVFVDKDRNEFSRKDIVLSLSNKEGGAHVDKKLDRKYSDLRKNNSLGWIDVAADGKKTPSADQVPATMRQIAHETLKTLKPGYECHREKSGDDGVFVMGASMVEGSTAPPIPKHNLPKNRPVITGKKIGRNDPCPCGSGRKYKKCCLK